MMETVKKKKMIFFLRAQTRYTLSYGNLLFLPFLSNVYRISVCAPCRYKFKKKMTLYKRYWCNKIFYSPSNTVALHAQFREKQKD